MTFEYQFVLFIICVLIGFSALMFFMLKYSDRLVSKNLKLTSTDAWNSIKSQAMKFGLDRSNLLYDIYQNESFTKVAHLLRDASDQNLGKTIFPTGRFKSTMEIAGQKYLISGLLAWRAHSILQQEGDTRILAEYVRTGWMGRHEIRINGFGTLISSRVSRDFKARYQYSLNGKVVGLIEHKINNRSIGRIAILPEEIPLAVRLFILSKHG